MTLNPIFALEVRSRWRMNRSFLLILGLAVSLCLVTLFTYQRAAGGVATEVAQQIGALSPANNLGLRVSFVGRELFVSIAQANILLWLFLGAASASTAIARERERGLLESLQLSPMSAPAQVGARLGANLLLLLALQCLTLPIYSVTLLIGGVAPFEIAGAFALVACAGVLGSCVGLWFSARAHRPTGALLGSVGALILFSGALVLLRINSSGPSLLGEYLLFLHPNALFWALTEANVHPLWGRLDLIILEGTTWLLGCGALVFNATAWVARPLPPAAWGARARWVEKLKAKQELQPARSARAQKASGALLADVPLDRFVRFSDPLLSREVKSRFRLRQGGFWVNLVRFSLFLSAAAGWIWEIAWLSDAPSRPEFMPSALRAFLYAGTLILAGIAATSWTRERESGTWEGLKLSLLPPRQILRSKWLSPLVSLLYYSAPLWVLLPIGAFYVDGGAALKGALVVLSWMGLSTALGLWMSWRARNGAASMAWTTGALAIVLIGLPWLNNLVGLDDMAARLRYGLDGRGAYGNGLIYVNGQYIYDPNAVAFYVAQTGQSVNSPVWASTVNGTRPYWNYYDGSFENWSQEQQREAREFKANLWAWHPDIALKRLFAQSERKGAGYYGYYGDDELPRTAQAPLSFGLSTLVPLGMTFLLLGFLRRDVRREQLKS